MYSLYELSPLPCADQRLWPEIELKALCGQSRSIEREGSVNCDTANDD